MLPGTSLSLGADESTSNLIVLEGRLAQTRLPLTQPIIFMGSDPACDIWLPYPEVAPRHAILAQTTAGWHIRTLDVSKTVAVNGKTTGFAAIAMGDRIGIGHQILELEVASSRRKSEPEASTSLRLHAAAVAALHAGAIEERWNLDQNQRSMIRRARQIAKRLKKRHIQQSPHEYIQAMSPAPAIASLKDREDLLALEQARLDRLRKRLLKRWNTQFGAAREALARREEEVIRRENLLHSRTDAQEIRKNQRSCTQQAAADSPSINYGHLTLRADLLADLNGLRQRNERIRNVLPRDWPVPEPMRNQSIDAHIGHLRPADANDDVMRLLDAAKALAEFQARWDADMASSLMSLEDQAIRMAQREHLIAEREALLETLLEQRVRQSDELNQTINVAAREHTLSILQRECAETEIKRLQRELANLNDVWNSQAVSTVAHEDGIPPAETLITIQRQLETLIELLEKTGEWACEDPTSSERAELEFLRFNMTLYENEAMFSQDAAGAGLRQVVHSVCEKIQNGPLANLRELVRHPLNNTPSIDRRLVMEAKRWRIRAESLEEALSETQRLLANATGNAESNTKIRSIRAA